MNANVTDNVLFKFLRTLSSESNIKIVYVPVGLLFSTLCCSHLEPASVLTRVVSSVLGLVILLLPSLYAFAVVADNYSYSSSSRNTFSFWKASPLLCLLFVLMPLAFRLGWCIDIRKLRVESILFLLSTGLLLVFGGLDLMWIRTKSQNTKLRLYFTACLDIILFLGFMIDALPVTVVVCALLLMLFMFFVLNFRNSVISLLESFGSTGNPLVGNTTNGSVLQKSDSILIPLLNCLLVSFMLLVCPLSQFTSNAMEREKLGLLR